MASSLEQSDHKPIDLCKFCLKCRAKYTCPKCGTPYCSVACYKSEAHIDCSEAFYQEWVESELKGSHVSSDNKRKMLEILNKSSYDDIPFDDDLDSDDEEPVSQLSERLSGIDLDNSDAVWEKLSEDERTAFKQLIKSGEIGNLIPSWEPWWSLKVKSSKVIDLDIKYDTESEFQQIRKVCPVIYRDIKMLSEISCKEPSPSVKFDLVNILGSYAITIRYFNANHFDFAEETIKIINKLSKSLVSAQNFNNRKSALDSVATEAFSLECLEFSPDELETMKKDVKNIINGPRSEDKNFYVLCALSDMRRLFSRVVQDKKKSTGKFTSIFPNGEINIKALTKKECSCCLRRIQYFLSYALTEY